MTEDDPPALEEPHASSTAPALKPTAGELVGTSLLAQVPAPGGGTPAAVSGTSPQPRSSACLSHEQPGEALADLASFSLF